MAKKGDRVRITWEGIYEKGEGLITITDDTGVERCFNGRNATIEVIEPEYEVGQLYRNSTGSHYVRTSEGDWRGLRTGRVVKHSSQGLPMVKQKIVDAD